MGSNVWLPKSLYDRVPYFYLGSGIGSITLLDNRYATFGGILLICAGLLIFWRRTTARTGLQSAHRRA